LLENYGFEVYDLGSDVEAEEIADAAVSHGASLVALSALMTTTAPEMARVIELVRERSPKARVMVGGAVLTEDYAREIGADFYGKDAMTAVRFAERVEAQL
jgi:5-methyltetrahydrofolate--homocysteine methyltransferase